MTEKDRCISLTQKGEQCKNPATCDSRFCRLHQVKHNQHNESLDLHCQKVKAQPPTRVTSFGEQIWEVNGRPDRDCDQPATITKDGSREWYKDGQLHRDGDRPAVIESNGTRMWFQHGVLHRDGNQPAVIWPDGEREWWKNGRLISKSSIQKITSSVTM